MRTGFAKSCVSPPLGMAMEGLHQTEVCKAIHDDLFVRALWLSHDGAEALIVAFDLLFFERCVVDRFKGALGRRLNLRPCQIFLNTTHTHAGPRVTRWHYNGAPEPLYLDQVEEAMLDAAARAKAKLRDVTIWAGMTRTDLPVSRRKPTAGERVEWKPYRKGAICDALPFCVFKDAGGSVVALLFSVSCHPSMIYECAISAEYPGAAMRLLNAHFQTDGSMFLQGAGGETKPRHIADGDKRICPSMECSLARIQLVAEHHHAQVGTSHPQLSQRSPNSGRQLPAQNEHIRADCGDLGHGAGPVDGLANDLHLHVDEQQAHC